jgi:hypothetical protein
MAMLREGTGYPDKQDGMSRFYGNSRGRAAKAAADSGKK